MWIFVGGVLLFAGGYYIGLTEARKVAGPLSQKKAERIEKVKNNSSNRQNISEFDGETQSAVNQDNLRGNLSLASPKKSLGIREILQEFQDRQYPIIDGEIL